jgi:hypothetical protein
VTTEGRRKARLQCGCIGGRRGLQRLSGEAEWGKEKSAGERGVGREVKGREGKGSEVKCGVEGEVVEGAGRGASVYRFIGAGDA